MAQVIYAKYNKLRRKEFRIRTCIYEEGTERWVEKAPVCPEAKEHVRKMAERKEQLEKLYPRLEFVTARPAEDSVCFDYLTGESVDSLLARRMKNADSLFLDLTGIFERILPDKERQAPFLVTPEFREIFGQGTGLEGLAAAASVNIDCLLENLLVKEDKFICLDYEWVFDFPVPIDFIRYRVIHYFYKSHPEAARLIGGNELLARFGLTALDCAIYAAMELEFQHYVFGGENDCRYTENYRKPVTSFDQMLSEKARTEKENEELRKVVNHYEQVERKLRKVGLWQLLQLGQKAGRKVKGVFRREK